MLSQFSQLCAPNSCSCSITSLSKGSSRCTPNSCSSSIPSLFRQPRLQLDTKVWRLKIGQENRRSWRQFVWDGNCSRCVTKVVSHTSSINAGWNQVAFGQVQRQDASTEENQNDQNHPEKEGNHQELAVQICLRKSVHQASAVRRTLLKSPFWPKRRIPQTLTNSAESNGWKRANPNCQKILY